MIKIAVSLVTVSCFLFSSAVACRAETGTLAPLSIIKPSDIKAVGVLEPALAERIAAAASSSSYSRTPKNNGEDVNMGSAEVPPAGALLVGFEVFQAGGEKWTRSLRPYYKTAEGLVAGKDRGYMQAVNEKVIARPGFAVAGFITDQRKRGFQVIL